MFKKTSIFRGVAAVGVFALATSIYASNLLETNKIMVDQTLGTKSSIIVTDKDDDSLFKTFVPDKDLLDENGKIDPVKWDKAHKDAAVKLQEEGTVLLKNDKALPINKAAKVSMFGTRSAGLVNAFKDCGFDVNPALSEAYGSRASTTAPGYANNKMPYKLFDQKEVSKADLLQKNPDLESTFANYHDAAIVVLGRQNAEGADYKKGADAVDPSQEARNSLASTKNEREIVDWATSNFDKVIVLVETVSQMELGYLKDNNKVQAILYVGLPDSYGSSAKGIYNILTGAVNPSGGLYDIYASHSESSPAMVNMGLYEFSNKDDVKLVQDKNLFGRGAQLSTEAVKALIALRDEQGTGRIDTSSIGTGGTDFGFYNYLIESEGIYVGYRYYETRYEDCVLNQGNANSTTGVFDSTANWKYTEEVDYGFGFGLSYTQFEFSLGDVTFQENGKHEIIAKFDVTVKNTGSVAGKTPIQIYSQSPYTTYDIENGVEKSAIQLVTFEKSGLINPGESKTYPVTVDLQDVASYDANNKKTYIMEESDDYYFAVGNGAHDALNNVLAHKGKKVADGMDYDGNAAAAKKWGYHFGNIEDGIDAYTFGYSKTGVKIENQLGKVTWNDFEKGKIKELTRHDWTGTWPVEQKDLKAPDEMLKLLRGEYFEVKTKANRDVTDEELAKMFGQKSDLKFADMKLAEFDDYRWDEVVSSMTLEEAIDYALQSGRGFADVETIGFPTGSYAENGAGISWLDPDSEEKQAPWKVAKPEGSYPRSTIGYFNTYAIWASSFNREVMNEIGRLMGNDSIVGDKPIVWLPGANTHRTPYGGRASQYFCEDPVLTGICTMEVAYSALQKGGIITAKHFAFNDQEGGRSGISPFMTEQRAREIELRAFQIPVEMHKYDTPEKDYAMLGLMTSFSKIGAVECTASYGLMTNILRKEWGYNGYVVSDLKDDLDIMPQTLLAGSTGYDWRTYDVDIAPYKDAENFKYDKAVLEAIKDACKRKLWVFAHTPLVNSVNRSSHTVWNMTSWRAAYITGISVSSVVLTAGVVLYTVALIVNRRKEN